MSGARKGFARLDTVLRSRRFVARTLLPAVCLAAPLWLLPGYVRAQAVDDAAAPADASVAAPDPAPEAPPPAAGGAATVRAEAPRRAPSDYTFDVRTLRAVPRSSAAEFLTLAPGFLLSQHGGDGKAHQIFLRGFDAQHGQDVEFTVGGLPINEVSNVHGQGYADLNFMIPEAVDRVRVLEGPFDPRQGDFAVAGSARFDLGAADRGALLRASYGMFNTARAVALVAPEGERRETFLAGEYARSDGFGENRASSRAAAMGQYARELAGGAVVRALAFAYAARFDSAGVVREDDHARGRDFFASYDTRQGGFSSRHGLVVELTLPRGAHRTAVSAFAALRELRVRENFTGFALDPRGDRFEQTYDAVTAGLTASHRAGFSLFGRAQSWEAGVSARHDVTSQAMRRLRQADDAAYATPVDADVNATDIGLYADLDLRLHPRLSIRGGVRADALAYQIDDRASRDPSNPAAAPRGRRDAQGLQLGPRVTVDVDLGAGFSVTGAYGKGFRSPQALSLGAGESAPFAVVHAGEVGGRLRRWFGSASVTLFATHVDRDLVFVPELGTNVVNEATAATTRLGVAALVRATPIRGVEVVVSGTWARATYDANGLLVPYVPPLVGRLDVAFTREVARAFNRPLTVSAGLGATALGERPLPFSERSPAWLVVDAGASVRLGPVELGVSGRNLTDARWRDGVFAYPSDFTPGPGGSAVPVQHFTAGRPLTVLSSLTLYL